MPGILGVAGRCPSILMLSAHCLCSPVRCCTIFSNYCHHHNDVCHWLAIFAYYCIPCSCFSERLSHPKLLNLEASLSLAPSKINTYDEPSTLVQRTSRDKTLKCRREAKSKTAAHFAWHGSLITPLSSPGG